MALKTNSTSHPLNLCHVKTRTLIINRLYTFFHSIALAFLIYYRASSILTLIDTKTQPLIPHLLIFVAELTLSFIWILSQSFLWRPVIRTVFPERLPEDEQLPPIDVFICTADPEKEPPLGVMNTVISAMSLNYPARKLTVYLSDDGGCPVTLEAMREAWRFAKTWLPFCKKYGVTIVCPEAYFAGRGVDDEVMVYSDEFAAEKLKVKVLGGRLSIQILPNTNRPFTRSGLQQSTFTRSGLQQSTVPLTATTIPLTASRRPHTIPHPALLSAASTHESTPRRVEDHQRRRSSAVSHP